MFLNSVWTSVRSSSGQRRPCWGLGVDGPRGLRGHRGRRNGRRPWGLRGRQGGGSPGPNQFRSEARCHHQSVFPGKKEKSSLYFIYILMLWWCVQCAPSLQCKAIQTFLKGHWNEMKRTFLRGELLTTLSIPPPRSPNLPLPFLSSP